MTTPPGDYSGYKSLLLDVKDGIMTVTFSNPRKKNALTARASEELTTIWHDVWRDPKVRVVILTGAGDAFCAGYDLSEAGEELERGDQSRALVKSMTRLTRLHMTTMLECEKPILAKVRGPAYGLGANLMLACDMIFASETARIADPHVKGGMVAGDGAVLFWPLAIGFHRAKEYLMTGDPVSATEAANIGLINRCLPDDQLDGAVQAMAEKLRDLPPNAVNFTKVALNSALRQMTQSAFETSTAYELYTVMTADFREATAAFMEKRKGVFTGD
jgi:enoyl-CoA hydratase